MARDTGTSNWKDEFKNKHVNSGDTSDFISAFKTVIYAKRADKANVESVDDIDAFFAIGVIQAYNWNEQKGVELIFELGSDIPYAVPGRTVGSLNLNRCLLFGNDIVNALYGNAEFDGDDVTAAGTDKVINSIKDITEPLDILFVAYKGDGDTQAKKYSKVFKNCHINSRSESIQAGSVIITEGVGIIYENIVGCTIK